MSRTCENNHDHIYFIVDVFLNALPFVPPKKREVEILALATEEWSSFRSRIIPTKLDQRAHVDDRSLTTSSTQLNPRIMFGNPMVVNVCKAACRTSSAVAPASIALRA